MDEVPQTVNMKLISVSIDLNILDLSFFKFHLYYIASIGL